MGTLTFAKHLAVVRLLTGIRSGVAADDVLVPFLCLRGIVEQIASYHVTIEKLRPVQVPGTFEEANKQLGSLLELFNKRLYGTRVDWLGLARGDDADARIRSPR